MLQIPKGRWPRQHFYAEYARFRYGPKKKPQPSLPKLFTGERRENAIDGVTATLEQFRLSKFEHEADCRNGIRTTLCLRGHSWDVADATAADVVKEALRRMGAERPSWEEGQWHYAIPRENCLRCGNPINDDDIARGFRHCSPMCARAHKVDLYGKLKWDSELRLAAYWQAYIGGGPTFTCEHCGNGFKSRLWNNKKKKPRFCSPKCRTDGLTVPPKPCEWCGTLFKSDKRKARCCSQRCSQRLRVKEYRESLTPEKTCPVCQSAFRPKHDRSIYCSEVCHRLESNARRRARDAQKSAAASGFICEAAD